jgi:hypothetical protein
MSHVFQVVEIINCDHIPPNILSVSTAAILKPTANYRKRLEAMCVLRGMFEVHRIQFWSM